MSAFFNYAETQIYYPSGIATGSDGALWFTNGSNSIGRITTGGIVTEYLEPGFTGAGAITNGPNGALWLSTGTGVGKFVLADTGGVPGDTPPSITNQPVSQVVELGKRPRSAWVSTLRRHPPCNGRSRPTEARLTPRLQEPPHSPIPSPSPRPTAAISRGSLVQRDRRTGHEQRSLAHSRLSTFDHLGEQRHLHPGSGGDVHGHRRRHSAPELQRNRDLAERGLFQQ